MQAVKICAIGALCQLVAANAQAQQPATLTLACKGTVTNSVTGEKPEPVSMGVTINFTARSVRGFGYPMLDDPVEIQDANDLKITFGSTFGVGLLTTSIFGSIDRVTGDLEATASSEKEHNILSQTTYELQCRPAQRMF